MIIYSKSRVTFQNIPLSREKEESFLVGEGRVGVSIVRGSVSSLKV